METFLGILILVGLTVLCLCIPALIMYVAGDSTILFYHKLNPFRTFNILEIKKGETILGERYKATVEHRRTKRTASHDGFSPSFAVTQAGDAILQALKEDRFFTKNGEITKKYGYRFYK